MKKFTVLMLAALLVVAFAMPASALENIFGGMWQTRFFTQKYFDGGDDGNNNTDITQVDTRTRLYYTAKLNDNLKLVNKFEMDAVWGDAVTGTNYGDAGADGIKIEIKNSYADFNVGPANFLVGVQNFTLGRGFVNNDDAAGMKAIYKVNDGLYLPFIWKKDIEGGAGISTNNDSANYQDIDMYVFTPLIYLSKDIKINPYYAFMNSRDGAQVSAMPNLSDNVNVSIIGLDFDAKMGAASFWFTGVFQTGDATATAAGAGVANRIVGAVGAADGISADSAADRTKTVVAGDSIKLAGYLFAAGGKFDLGKADIHGQAFYASGENEKGWNDKKVDAYFTTPSTDYHWAEILGNGLLENLAGNVQASPIGSSSYTVGITTAPNGCRVSNITAVNLGTTIKPMDKLTITADLWWAQLNEGNRYTRADGTLFYEKDLGIETDLLITYQLVEGLNLDIIGAYLFAGDAISRDGKNDRDPFEFGTRLSLSF